MDQVVWPNCELLTIYEELAYRRILNYLLITKDRLPDDPAVLRRLSRAGKRWKHVCAALLEKGLIEIETVTDPKTGKASDFIRNRRATEMITKAMNRATKGAR